MESKPLSKKFPESENKLEQNCQHTKISKDNFFYALFNKRMENYVPAWFRNFRFH